MACVKRTRWQEQATASRQRGYAGRCEKNASDSRVVVASSAGVGGADQAAALKPAAHSPQPTAAKW